MIGVPQLSANDVPDLPFPLQTDLFSCCGAQTTMTSRGGGTPGDGLAAGGEGDRTAAGPTGTSP